MPTVDVAPDVLTPGHVPHVCVVSGEPTDTVRMVRVAQPLRVGTALLLGPLVALLSARVSGITVHLPVAPSVSRRRGLALVVAAAGPIVPIAAAVAGLAPVVVLGAVAVGAPALLVGFLVAQRYAPAVRYDPVDDRVRIVGAHEAFVAALPRSAAGA